jgi:transcriptional regulator
MYIPESFRETDAERILALVESYPFGQLITAPEGVPFVSHLPFLLDRSDGKPRLLGHMARANPQWQHLSAQREVLAVFTGPHAYVSPGWYSSPGVPTWNYAVAHLRGRPRLIEDGTELEALLERLTRVHEARMPNPWQSALSDEKRAKLLGMIVGFEIEIADLQAKFKLSQNRPEEDQQRVAEALGRSGDQTDAAVARLMSAPGRTPRAAPR